ncbi:pyruvate kinase [Platysternon megacephalum]|uniref:Pyruvate kinase n=1 Tax=Platysternon megacephalum TaxID=55544 RepID=A0A4D9DK47_9SAUR|nr:pyruvate kinase [Platysternon megacephalum]
MGLDTPSWVTSQQTFMLQPDSLGVSCLCTGPRSVQLGPSSLLLTGWLDTRDTGGDRSWFRVAEGAESWAQDNCQREKCHSPKTSCLFMPKLSKLNSPPGRFQLKGKSQGQWQTAGKEGL